MKTVVFAYHNIGCTGIRALLDAGFDIRAVFTHRDDPGERLFFGSVAQLCAEHGLTVHAPDNVNTPFWIDAIRDLAPDFFFSFYYRQLLGEALLSLPRQGAYNLHGSLLPAYRGRAPVNWALLGGETHTGVTLHQMVQRPDAGDIAGQHKVIIEPDETALTLHQKLDVAAAALLSECLPRLRSGTIELSPQDESKASYFGRRGPADGALDWSRPAVQLERLVRAVTLPYPGAFTFAGRRKLIVWRAAVATDGGSAAPGTILNTDPLQVMCGDGAALEIHSGESEQGLPVAGVQLAREMGLVQGIRLEPQPTPSKDRLTRVLILGVNGFIGSHLVERLLDHGGFEVYGMDIGADKVQSFLNCPRFRFVEGDISIHREWLEYHIKKCDVVVPLVAIATPIEYVRNPLRVFELDFEENLKIVRYCVKYDKRIVFPSTSEVYGMCREQTFNEETSNLVLGPINKQRWIYSASKQLLDRVIWAYGDKQGLRFTLFRPFNWMGPRLDSLDSARIGSSRAITQLILNLVEGTPINLVDGGMQKRCFTDIEDGIEALFAIVANHDDCCDGRIINIGNPDNEASIRELADILLEKFEQHPLRPHFPPFAGMNVVENRAYYGAGYQDVSHRRPSIDNARRLLGWSPRVSLDETVGKTLDFFLERQVRKDDTP